MHQTKYLVFFDFRLNSIIIGIGSLEHSQVGVSTTKSGKRSALVSEISEKKIIVYTYYCIEKAIIGRTLSNTNSNDSSHIHSWDDEDHYFDYQLYKWDVEKFIQTSDELIIRQVKVFVEDWEKLVSRTKSNYRVLCLW